MNLVQVFDRELWGNAVGVWLWAIGTFIVLTALLWVIRKVILRRLQPMATRSRTVADDVIVAVLERTQYVFLVALALAIALRLLTLSESARGFVRTLVVLTVLLQLGIWANALIADWLQRYTKARVAADPTSITTIRAVAYGARLLAWAILLLVALDNLGINVTALITGLGIGGVAVALAVQNILGDIFAALAIMLDKPFVIGDFITVGSEMGTVERIGIKTTRMRGIGGEQIVFSNADLLQSRVRNFRRLEERRVLFRFGVLYDTPQEKLEALPGIARDIVLAQDRVRFGRAHLAALGDSALEFEVEYYVLSSEYVQYMNTQQRINLELIERCRREGIEFAYPTQTVHVIGNRESGIGNRKLDHRHAESDSLQPRETGSSDLKISGEGE